MRFVARRGARAGVSAPGDYGCVPLPITRETWRRLCLRPYARLPPFSRTIRPRAPRFAPAHLVEVGNSIWSVKGGWAMCRCLATWWIVQYQPICSIARGVANWYPCIKSAGRERPERRNGQEGEEREWKFGVPYTTRYRTYYHMLGRFHRGQRTVLADPSLVVRP